MKSQGSGGKVLRFAVTGALLGGGAMTGCASKQTVNVAPMENPEATEHTNAGPEPVEHTNAGPEGEPVGEPDGPHVNTAPVEGPPDAADGGGNEPPKVMVNPAPQPDPAG